MDLQVLAAHAEAAVQGSGQLIRIQAPAAEVQIQSKIAPGIELGIEEYQQGLQGDTRAVEP